MINIDRLDLKKLRAFYFVARHGSLRDAASRLNVSVSAVSVSVSRLESQLGIQLFERMPNKLILTPAGDRFLRSAEAIFSGIEKILADSASDIVPGGRLSISVSGDLAWHFIPKISDFLRRYNDIQLGLYINSSPRTLRMVQRGEINMGIGRFRRVPSELHLEPLIDSSISLVCKSGHPLLEHTALSLEDLAQYTLITLPAWQSTRQMIDAAFANSNVRLGNHIEAGNCQAVMEFVQAGLGIGLIHTFCAKRDTSGTLGYVELSQHFGTLTFSAIYQKQASASPALFRFLQECTSKP